MLSCDWSTSEFRLQSRLIAKGGMFSSVYCSSGKDAVIFVAFSLKGNCGKTLTACKCSISGLREILLNNTHYRFSTPSVCQLYSLQVRITVLSGVQFTWSVIISVSIQRSHSLFSPLALPYSAATTFLYR